MVAIFTGLGVGFERGSAAALGSGGLLGSSSLGRGLEGVFLNAANGNLVLQRQDEFLVGRGPDASIARTYNSQGALDEDGDDWRYSTDRRVFELTGTLGATGSSVKRVSADGSVITYKWNGSLYIAKEGSGAHDTLQHTAAVTGPPAVPAYWTWTEGSSQIKETYTEAESGVFRIKTQRDGDANTITFHYNSSDPTKLERVETADGGYTAYVWTGAHITKVETYVTGGLSTPSLTRTYYAYDSEDRLASVTVDLSPEDNSTASGGAYTITYGYDGTSNRVTSISQSDGSLLTIGYIYDSGSLSFRVTSLAQTVATGDTRTTNIEYFAGRTEITDARGQVTKLYFEISDTDNLSQLKQVVAPAAYTGATPQEIDYAYDSDGNLTSVTDAMDHVTSYQYDASGNVTKITNANGNVTDRAYDSANNLTLETFTGATANSAAATLYRRFVYDGENHLRFSISADGNVTEYRYTGPGELEYAITYPDDDYATGSSVPTLTDMETWRDGLANRATTQIVKYIYDTRGNLSDTYGYSGATNAGVADASKGYVRTHTVRDQSGRLLSRFVEGQATESFVYDGLGRVLLSTDLAGGVTKIAFTDATTTTVVTTNVAYNSGTSSWDATTWSLTSTSVYNKAGERTGHTEAGLHVYGGTATYLYDKNGQLRRATDARGHKSYFIYDKTGRKVADVGADGQLVEYRYDQAGRVVATTRYTNLLTSTQLTTLDTPTSEVEMSSIRPTASGSDIWDWRFYDAGGRLIETIAGDGAVTAFSYDQADRLIATRGYFNKLSSGQISALIAAPPTSAQLPATHADDVIVRSFYDGDGRLIGALNGEGYLSEIVYDDAGRKIQEIGYATITNAGDRATGAFATLRTGLANAADISTRYFYDGQGLMRFALDALNRVTQYVYWDGTTTMATGLVRKTIQHAAPLTAPGGGASYSYDYVLANLTSSSANDRIGYSVYNDRAQLTYSVDATGAATHFVYDAEGRVTKATQMAVLVDMSTMGNDAAWKANLDTWRAANSAGARIARNYYTGRELRYSIDAEGYVTRYDYDQDGRVAVQYRHATKVAATDAWTLSTVEAADKGAAVTNSFFYDGLGRLSYQLDANGVRTQIYYAGNGTKSWEFRSFGQGMDESRIKYTYDQTGRLTGEHHYASEIFNAGIGTPTLLNQAEQLISPNGAYSAMLTREGELRIHHNGELTWTSGVSEIVAGATYRLVAQTDGNLVIYRDVAGQPQVGIWHSNTWGSHSGATFLAMQDDGALLLCKGTSPTSTGTIWNSGSAGLQSSPGAILALSKAYAYDGLGRLASVTNSNGAVTAYGYDKVGRVVTETDGIGRVTSYQYDAFGRGVKTTRPGGLHDFAYFDKLGRVSLAIDAGGYATETSYNAFGEIAAVTRRFTQTSGAAIGAPPSVTIDAGADSVVGFTYDKLGRTLIITDALGGQTIHVYDALGNLVKRTDALGSDTYYYYDALGRVDLEIDPENYATSTTYTSLGLVASKKRSALAANGIGNVSVRPTLTSDARDATTSYAYDPAGRLTSQTNAQGEVTSFEYDRRGNVVKVTDARGGVTVRAFNKQDQLISETNPLGHTIRYQYNTLGHVAKTTDARGNASYNYYDALGRITLAVDAEGYATQTAYTNAGQVQSVVRRAVRPTGVGNVTILPTIVADAALDATTSFTYDALGRVLTQTDAQGAVTSYEYDAAGNAVKTTNALLGVTERSFDKLGRVSSEVIWFEDFGVVGSKKATNTFSYDANGNLISKVEAGIRTTLYDYDDLGRLVLITHNAFKPVSTATGAASASLVTPTEEFFYNANGDLIEKRDQLGARTLQWYDKVGRVTYSLSAEGTLTHHAYDENGNVTLKRVFADKVALPANANGAPPTEPASSRAIAYAYDALDRVTSVSQPSAMAVVYSGTLTASAQVAVTSYVYDAMGNVVLVTDPNGGATYSYFDKLGRKTSQIDAGIYRTDWSYNGDGNVMSERRYANLATWPGGGANTTAPAAVTNHDDDRVTNFTYDRMGRRLTETREAVKINDTAAPGTNATQNVTITYAYNGLGQVLSKTEATNDAIAYTYDRGGRLTREQRSGYADVNGNTVTPTVEYEYNALSDVTLTRALGAAGAVATAARDTIYQYGDGGRLEWKADSAGFKRHYFYDAAGRVRREEYNRTDLSSGTRTEAIGYEYDLEGRVVRQGMLLASASGDPWTRASAAIDTVAMLYNAYGEMIGRGFNVADANLANSAHYLEKFVYNEAGRLWKTNSGDGTWKYFFYDKAGNQTLAIASTGLNIDDKTESYMLGLWANAAAIATTDVTGVIAAITRLDARNQAIEVREPRRQRDAATYDDLRTVRTYNAFGEVTRETNAHGFDSGGNVIENASISYTYNTMGRLLERKSPEVSVTSATNVTTTVRPTEKYFYDKSGRLVASRDANDNLTRMTLLAGTGYGGTQALVSEAFGADGSVTRTKFDIHGDARRIESPLYHATLAPQHVTLQSFDTLGRVTQVNQAGGLVQYYAYDGLGQRTKYANNFYNSTVVGNPHYNASFNAANAATWNNAEQTAYDHQGRITQVIAMGGDTTAYAYAWDSALTTSGLGQFGGWTQTTTYANTKTLIESKDIFGRSVGKTDLGGNVSGFTYDKSGRLVQRSGGTALNYAYFNTGRVHTVSATIASAPHLTTYGYDKLGSVLSQVFTKNTTEVLQNAAASYDALGRMTSWSEAGSAATPAASLTYEYDANGNIRRSRAFYRVVGSHGAFATSASEQDYWYRYDAMNRVITQKGALVGGAIVRGAQGADFLYDGAGQRVQMTMSFADQYQYNDPEVPGDHYWVPFTNDRVEYYTYDSGGRLTEVKVSEGYYTNDHPSYPYTAPSLEEATRRGAFSYDAMGRMLSQHDYQSNGTTVSYSRAVVYNSKGQVASDSASTRQGADAYTSETAFTYGTGSGYALGAALTVTTQNWKNAAAQPTTLTTNTYIWGDGAVQSQVAYDSSTANATNPINTSTYSYATVGGQLQMTQAAIIDGRSLGGGFAGVGGLGYFGVMASGARTVTFVSDLSGQVIRRDESDAHTTGDPHEHWYRFAGKQLGYVGNNGTSDLHYKASANERIVGTGAGAYRNGSTSTVAHADFDQSLTPINSFYQGSAGGGYRVRAGDTLGSIAANLWGDSALWYKIAEVNGLSAGATLVEGQSLTLPTGAMKSTHSASTFSPYDPTEVLGSTSPTAPKPQKENKCGGFGMVLLVVIAIAVTVITRMPIIKMLSGLGVSASTAIVAGSAMAGAAGSIASQGVGVATGIQDKFSWNAVALAAIGGGVGGAMGGANPATWGQAATQAIKQNLVIQGIGLATGLQSKFSWAGMAAAGVGAAVAHGVMPSAELAKIKIAHSATSGAYVGASLGRGMASALANAAARSLIDGSDFGDNIIAALPDVIGQTVGEAIAGGISGNGSTTGDGGSIFEGIGDGLSAVGDFLGFDGSFGYQGPEGRSLSLDGLGSAIEHVGAEIVHRVEHESASPAAQGGGNQTVATDFSLDPGDSDLNDAVTTLASLIYARREDGNVYYTWGGQVDSGEVARAEAGLLAIGYEPYDPRAIDDLNLLQRALIGMDAHQVLTDIARAPLNFRGWAANVSIVEAANIRFVGRVDLVSIFSRETWELKPDNIRAILSGEAQVVGYVASQRDLRDIPGVLTHSLANPFRVANRSPQEAGLVGLDGIVGHPGRYGWYTFRYAGNGVEAYTWSNNGALDWLSTTIHSVPNPFPWPIPGRRDDTAPRY